MWRIQIQEEDSKLEAEKQIKYKGTARIRLKWLHFQRNHPRDLDAKNIERLKSIFRKDCRRLDVRNHIPAVIEQQALDLAIQQLGISAQQLNGDAPDGYKSYLHLSVLLRFLSPPIKDVFLIYMSISRSSMAYPSLFHPASWHNKHQTVMAFPYPLIALEEHWLAQSVRDFYVTNNVEHPNDENGLVGMITPALMEFGETRLKAMDESGLSLQVVSHAPNTLALDLATCVKVNNELSDLIQSRPGRFRGFATLPMATPEAASRELRRCVEDLGFVGTLIDSNCEGRFYDDHSFWPVFEAAAELDVPVYLHPSPNLQTKPLLYNGNYPDAVAESLSEYGWGWHNETAVHFLRLFAAGLFDRYPTLKIVLGHLGEMLPFQLDRIEGVSTRLWPHVGLKLQRNLRQVWDESVWITTSGMFFLAPMACVLRQCKPDRIMFSVDYPFGRNEAGLAFLKALKAEGMVSDDVLEGIAYKNAERLLKVTAK